MPRSRGTRFSSKKIIASVAHYYDQDFSQVESALLAFYVTLRGFSTLRWHLNDNRKSKCNFKFPKGKARLFINKCIYQDAWDSYFVYKMTF